MRFTANKNAGCLQALRIFPSRKGGILLPRQVALRLPFPSSRVCIYGRKLLWPRARRKTKHLLCVSNFWHSSLRLPITSYFSTSARRVTCYSYIWGLSPFKACGPDAIPNRILKEFALEIADPVTTIFNRSLLSGTFPTAWKDPHITPLAKTTPVTCDSDLRPIALTACLSKVFQDFFRAVARWWHEGAHWSKAVWIS